jgi:hypothetical protein
MNPSHTIDRNFFYQACRVDQAFLRIKPVRFNMNFDSLRWLLNVV